MRTQGMGINLPPVEISTSTCTMSVQLGFRVTAFSQFDYLL
jgi:hypothetical protein